MNRCGPQRPLTTPTSDHEGNLALYWFGIKRSVGNAVMLTLKIGAVVCQERSYDLHRFVEPVKATFDGRKLEPILFMFVLLPACAYAKHNPATRYVIDGRSNLCGERRVPIGVSGH